MSNRADGTVLPSSAENIMAVIETTDSAKVNDALASGGHVLLGAGTDPYGQTRYCIGVLKDTQQSKDVPANNRDAAMTPPILGGDHGVEPSSIPAQRTSPRAEAGTSADSPDDPRNDVMASRWRAGETIYDLADDYGIPSSVAETIIRRVVAEQAESDEPDEEQPHYPPAGWPDLGVRLIGKLEAIRKLCNKWRHEAAQTSDNAIEAHDYQRLSGFAEAVNACANEIEQALDA